MYPNSSNDVPDSFPDVVLHAQRVKVGDGIEWVSELSLCSYGDQIGLSGSQSMQSDDGRVSNLRSIDIRMITRDELIDIAIGMLKAARVREFMVDRAPPRRVA